MTEKLKTRPVLLCILDGWGHRQEKEFNAIAVGNTPNWDRFIKEYPNNIIETSGLDVGLPDGQMGNSEVGHMNIGAGRVVMQDLPRIDKAVENGSLVENKTFLSMVEKLKETKGVCHLMGLVSPGGVHSHQNHFVAIAKKLAQEGIKVNIHAFLDGRDTPPKSGKGFVKELNAEIKNLKNCDISVVSGRFYAMDRDNRWDRVEKAYNAMVLADGKKCSTADEAISNAYENQETDEFVTPSVIGEYDGMKDGDAVFMVNFRADRAREILYALCDEKFDGFERKKQVSFSTHLGMTEYSVDHNRFMKTVFPPQQLKNIFGEIVSKSGYKQLRIAETEKYAHVTFFFNGGEEQEYDGEERILVSSPKVATYDLQPEMSAPEVTEKLVEAIKSEKFDVIICNYANGDMVGHTGVMDAAVKAVEAVDVSIGKVEKAIKEVGGTMIVTADHGNCEQMVDMETGQPYTAHTIGVVPVVLVGEKDKKLRDGGRLADLAPTMLDLMGMEKPEEMTGVSLIEK